MDSALLAIISFVPRFPSPPLSSGPSSMPSSTTPLWPCNQSQRTRAGRATFIADATVAAELPHGAGLDDMARIEDTASTVEKGIDDGRLCCEDLGLVKLL